jgi:hypothetical protein
MSNILQLVVFISVFYPVNLMALKISIGLYFARLVVTPTDRYLNYAVITYSTLNGVFYAFFNIFLCGGSFGLRYAQKMADGQCVSSNGRIGAALVYGVSMAITDVTFVAVALNKPRTSMMTVKQKVTIGGVLVLAIV